MKLIEDYDDLKNTLMTIMRKAIDGNKKPEDDPVESLILLDIAHSLSIIAETMSAQYEQSKGLISASQSMLESTEKELAKLSNE